VLKADDFTLNVINSGYLIPFVWLVADTNIVEEILELKQNIRVYVYLRYRKKKKTKETRSERI